ncbi:MAG: phosphocholine cytidylyltransferase family protein [Candidatus Hodarchaeales archaeon]|jgi:choline kinase
MYVKDFNNSKISTAVILSAGNGVRLLPLTKYIPKCLIEVKGTPILVQLIDSLHKYEFKRIIIVIGYLGDRIVEIVQKTKRWNDIKIEFVFNKIYSTTNNIYSLWLTRNIVKESFLLLESDIVFDSFLLEEFLTPDRIALAEYIPSMTGTTVKLNDSGIVSKMEVGEILNDPFGNKKTVNIYSLSLSSWNLIKKELDQRISEGKLQDYYEIVFSNLIDEGNLILQGINFDIGKWYEVDTLIDLEMAEKLFLSEEIPILTSGINYEP